MLRNSLTPVNLHIFTGGVNPPHLFQSRASLSKARRQWKSAETVISADFHCLPSDWPV